MFSLVVKSAKVSNSGIIWFYTVESKMSLLLCVNRQLYKLSPWVFSLQHWGGARRLGGGRWPSEPADSWKAGGLGDTGGGWRWAVGCGGGAEDLQVWHRSKTLTAQVPADLPSFWFVMWGTSTTLLQTCCQALHHPLLHAVTAAHRALEGRHTTRAGWTPAHDPHTCSF